MEGRSNADRLVVDSEGRRDKIGVLQVLQVFLNAVIADKTALTLLIKGNCTTVV